METKKGIGIIFEELKLWYNKACSYLVLSLHDLIVIPYKNVIYLVFLFLFIIRGLIGRVINWFSRKEIFRKNNNKIYLPVALSIGIALLFLYYQGPV